MRKIGAFLKEERLNKNLTLSQMERDTKIKKQFIELIENDDWVKLPEFPVVSGFIKTIAKTLDVSENTAVALLRRDYPFERKKVLVNPKPDLKLRSTLNPKVIAIVASVFLGIVLLGYLFYQYMQYISPPKLVVKQPTENQEVKVGDVIISGETDSDATLSVNNQKILVSDAGEFFDKIQVGENTKQIDFVATSRYGKKTEVVRNIVLKGN